jgi:hypothetical protein
MPSCGFSSLIDIRTEQAFQKELHVSADFALCLRPADSCRKLRKGPACLTSGISIDDRALLLNRPAEPLIVRNIAGMPKHNIQILIGDTTQLFKQALTLAATT